MASQEFHCNFFGCFVKFDVYLNTSVLFAKKRQRMCPMSAWLSTLKRIIPQSSGGGLRRLIGPCTTSSSSATRWHEKSISQKHIFCSKEIEPWWLESCGP
jgi:hypothetical protein